MGDNYFILFSFFKALQALKFKADFLKKICVICEQTCIYLGPSVFLSPATCRCVSIRVHSSRCFPPSRRPGSIWRRSRDSKKSTETWSVNTVVRSSHSVHPVLLLFHCFFILTSVCIISSVFYFKVVLLHREIVLVQSPF